MSEVRREKWQVLPGKKKKRWPIDLPVFRRSTFLSASIDLPLSVDRPLPLCPKLLAQSSRSKAVGARVFPLASIPLYVSHCRVHKYVHIVENMEIPPPSNKLAAPFCCPSFFFLYRGYSSVLSCVS